MKVLLVRPQTPKASINLQSFMICEPLELEYVAASLKKDNNEVDLIDMLLENKSLKFYLKQNDVIYVQPGKGKSGQADFNQNNTYKVSIVSAIISGLSVIASLVIALMVK